MNKEQYNYLFNKVAVFKDMEDFEEKSFMDREELKEKLEEGFIQELTRGVYNGALNIFTPHTLTPDELVGALQTYISDTDFISTIADGYIDADEMETFENYTPYDVLEDFVCMYDVFSIGNYLYADIG